MKNLFLFLAMFLAIPASSLAFSDVPANNMYYETITQLKNNGIVKGYADNTFRVENNISRAEFLQIVKNAKFWQMHTLYGEDRVFYWDQIIPAIFTDVSDSDWFSSAVKFASNKNLINAQQCLEWEEGHYPQCVKRANTKIAFRPHDPITIAEALKITLRAFEIVDFDEKNTQEWFLIYFQYLSEHYPNFDRTMIGGGPNDPIKRGEMAYLISIIGALENEYKNGRYGFSVRYPKTFYQDGEAPMNGDGLHFTNGATKFTVSGSNNIDQSSVIEDMNKTILYWTSSEWTQDPVNITYKVQKDNWYVLSGTKNSGDTIVYTKTYVGKESINSIDFEYPSYLKDGFDENLEFIVNSFIPGDLTSGH